MNKKLVISVIVLAGIFALAWYVFFSEGYQQKSSLPSEDKKTEDTVNLTPSPGSGSSFARLSANAIYVAEQRPGNEVIVNNVNIEMPGYVVIHESVDGQAGAIIGSSALLDANGGTKIPVTLSRSVTDGEELIAMLHAEMGGAGFDASIDLPVLDSQGGVLFMNFTVSADAVDPSTIEVMF